MTLLLLLAQVFAIEIDLTPRPGFRATDYVNQVFNQIPFTQAKLESGRVKVTGEVRVDMRALDAELARDVQATLLRAVVNTSYDAFDLTDANVRIIPNPDAGPVVVVVGQTGMGKSRMANRLAEAWGLSAAAADCASPLNKPGTPFETP